MSTCIAVELHIDMTRASVHLESEVSSKPQSDHPKVAHDQHERKKYMLLDSHIFRKAPIFPWRWGKMESSHHVVTFRFDLSSSRFQLRDCSPLGLRFERDHRLSQQLWIKKCADLRFLGVASGFAVKRVLLVGILQKWLTRPSMTGPEVRFADILDNLPALYERTRL